MKKMIVTTTINPVTEAIRRFDARKDWDLVVVGDLKTPKNYRLKNGTYLSPKDQERIDRRLSDSIGWNVIQRRNFGLLWAYKKGADVIALVDDDNIPYSHWGKNLILNQWVSVNYYKTQLPAFDPVGATHESHLWHRGYPLQLLPKRRYGRPIRKKFFAQIQADFWDGDPDIDAICRLEHSPECKFKKTHFPMASNKMSPFNSQNTFISRSILKDYFLFPNVGRMDDIWASYYVQAKGFRVIYSHASVYQLRNPHDLIRDLKAEYLGYENNLEIVTSLPRNPSLIHKYLPKRSQEAFRLYQRHFK